MTVRKLSIDYYCPMTLNKNRAVKIECTWLFYGVDARVMTFAVRGVLCAEPGGLNLLFHFDIAKSCQMMRNLGGSWRCLSLVNTCK